MRLRDGRDTTSETRESVQKEDPSEKNMTQHSDLNGDYSNVSLLFLLYILQGIPLGMAGSIPMILQNKNITYKQQAVFSFVYWPFSLKLLWAPIVDAAFIKHVGRRKSWLIPTQYLIGFFMLMLSMHIDSILNAEVPNVLLLTVVFFALNFLAATQDIAVDGWALTMLQKRNVGYASTCNSVGQTAGYFTGNVVLLAFSSADFCNTYIRSAKSDEGIITLAGFLFFWGIVFLVTTTLVWMFKRERSDHEEHKEHGIVGTYAQLVKIVRLPSVQQLVLILLTVKVGFAATDAVTGLKLIEGGVKKETLALLAVPLVPLQILLPLLISRFTAGPRPLDLYQQAIPYRLLMGVVFAGIVHWTKSFAGTFPYYYYVTILFAYALQQVTLYTMFVSIMGFFARISDPSIGGTYMTLLNTLSNLGGNWPNTLVLSMVDPLSWKQCAQGSGMMWGSSVASDCSSPELVKVCMYTMVVCMMSLTSKVSLSSVHVGGTYITLINTFSNLGTRLPNSLALYCVDVLTWSYCSQGANKSCSGSENIKTCTDAGGRCITQMDGYYIETCICLTLGVLWLLWRKSTLNALQNLKDTAWKVSTT